MHLMLLPTAFVQRFIAKLPDYCQVARDNPALPLACFGHTFLPVALLHTL